MAIRNCHIATYQRFTKFGTLPYFYINNAFFIHPFFIFTVYNISHDNKFSTNPKDLKMEKKIKIAVIACGNRSRGVVNCLLKASKGNVEIVSVYDPDPAEMDYACKAWNTDTALHCASSIEAINAPGVEWVMIFSPNAFHKQHILEAFAANKDVFTEKPLATTIEDCKEIYNAYKASGKLFATGFVLRYSDVYRKIKSLLDSGKYGYLMTIEANENIRTAHGGYIMCNWRRKTEISGPHILEKCCHDLDLIEWFVGSLPSRVYAMGGRDFFKSENALLEAKYGADKFHCWRDAHKLPSPFHDDTDLMDNLISVAEFRNKVRVSFNCTMSNIIPERRMSFHCSEGNIIVDLYQKLIRCRNIGEEGELIIDFPTSDGHGGGDTIIMEELYDTMISGTAPKCSGSEGLESAVYALALDRAAVTGKVVDLEPVWASLGR